MSNPDLSLSDYAAELDEIATLTSEAAKALTGIETDQNPAAAATSVFVAGELLGELSTTVDLYAIRDHLQDLALDLSDKIEGQN
ncbi:MAG: hypothetical protein WCL22_06635 [bacterium]